MNHTNNNTTMRYYLDMATHYHAHHMQLSLGGIEGVQSCGEDALFVSPKTNMMGIADGVSAWSAYGLGNSGYLAYYLMSNAKALVEKGITNTPEIFPECVDNIWSLFDTKMAQIPNGSSTMTTLRLYEEFNKPCVQYSNLGDCMVVVLRPEKIDKQNVNIKVMHQSSKLYAYHEHARGVPVPLQIVFYPSQGRAAVPGQLDGIDTKQLALEEGDIIILATDGLWDNLTLHETIKTVSCCFAKFGATEKPVNPKEIASMLVEEAYRNNFKPDDISAVVAFVRQRNIPMQAM